MSPLATAPPGLAGPAGQRRAAYLVDLLRLLYPFGVGGRTYLVLPNPDRPRLLVPAASARVAAGAVRHGPFRSARTRLTRLAAAGLLRTGCGPLLLRQVRVEPAGSIEARLCQVVGHPVHLSIHIGAARANRKPVLHLVRDDGSSAGYAKLGTGPLTGALVRAEAAALLAVARARLRLVRAPTVWYAGWWHDHDLLVQSPLPTWRRPVTTAVDRRLAAAMRELAYSQGIGTGPLATSEYLHGLRARVAALTQPTGSRAGTGVSKAEAGALLAAATTLVERAGDVALRYGAWHGDWSPWNMAVLPETVLLWDFERFATGVPLGFDALHHALQHRLTTTPDAAAAVRDLLARTPALLEPFDVPPEAARVTGYLYLIELATRYLSDRQAEAGAPLGVLGTWLLPVLLGHLEVMR